MRRDLGLSSLPGKNVRGRKPSKVTFTAIVVLRDTHVVVIAPNSGVVMQQPERNSNVGAFAQDCSVLELDLCVDSVLQIEHG